MRYKEEFKQEEVNKFKADLATEYGAEPNISTVSPTVGKELAKNAIYALLYCHAWNRYLRCTSVSNGVWVSRQLLDFSMMYSLW